MSTTAAVLLLLLLCSTVLLLFLPLRLAIGTWYSAATNYIDSFTSATTTSSDYDVLVESLCSGFVTTELVSLLIGRRIRHGLCWMDVDGWKERLDVKNTHTRQMQS